MKTIIDRKKSSVAEIILSPIKVVLNQNCRTTPGLIYWPWKTNINQVSDSGSCCDMTLGAETALKNSNQLINHWTFSKLIMGTYSILVCNFKLKSFLMLSLKINVQYAVRRCFCGIFVRLQLCSFLFTRPKLLSSDDKFYRKLLQIAQLSKLKFS